MFKRSLALAAFACLLAGPLTAGAQEKIAVDPKLPAYEKVSGVSGNLSSVGSDTLINQMTLWREAFVRLYPSANITVEGKGSATAPPALTAGTAQLGPMSRPMKADEIEKFEAKFGYKPTEIAVALDALSVYVHKDNPIKSLNFDQLDAIFSSGGNKNATTWGELGLTGAWANRPLSLYGRNSASGTYAFFKEHALRKHDFKDTVKEQPGSSAVIDGIANDLAAVGYSGVGYLTSGVKAVPLSEKEGGEASLPTYKNVLAKKYPLSRALYLYVAKAPGKPLDPAVREFVKFALSKEGQELVVKEGFMPIPAALAAKQLEKIKD